MRREQFALGHVVYRDLVYGEELAVVGRWRFVPGRLRMVKWYHLVSLFVGAPFTRLSFCGCGAALLLLYHVNFLYMVGDRTLNVFWECILWL